MRILRSHLLMVAVAATIAGCHNKAIEASAVDIVPVPVDASSSTHLPDVSTPDAAPSCGPDIATRSPGAKPVDGIDVDGDSVLDLVFRASADMQGNAEFFFYRVIGACATYLGSMEAFFANRPYCVAPPQRGTICRMSATRRMYHDDYQETFYEHSEGAFRESGRGGYIPPPKHP